MLYSVIEQVSQFWIEYQLYIKWLALKKYNKKNDKMKNIIIKKDSYFLFW